MGETLSLQDAEQEKKLPEDELQTNAKDLATRITQVIEARKADGTLVERELTPRTYGVQFDASVNQPASEDPDQNVRWNYKRRKTLGADTSVVSREFPDRSFTATIVTIPDGVLMVFVLAFNMLL